MKKRRIFRIVLLLVVIAALFVFVRTIRVAMVNAPELEVAALASVSRAATSSASLPARLIIPALGIDASVEHVGVNYKGNMAAPADYDDVSWYEHGTVPGQRGSAVMAGHLNDGLGLSGVFKDLEKIRAGDEAFVVNEKGERIRFVVERVETYDYREVPLDELFNASDAVRLNLITCAGRWTWEGETYDKRTVVYASYR